MVVVTGSCLRLASVHALESSEPLFLKTAGPIADDRSAHFARIACDEAWSASRCGAAPERIGSTVTASKLGIGGLLAARDRGCVDGSSWMEFMAPRLAPDFARGPVVTTVSACATGLASWIRAAMFLENQEADAVFAGSAEGALHPFVVAGFMRMGVLSRLRPRPFDRRRDGFVPAEGAGIAVLEREDDARKRGAAIRGRVLGWAMAQDPTHPIAGARDGEAITRLIMKALDRSRLSPADLAYVHLHGTGTIQNDIAEAAALRKIFDARGHIVPASSTKSVTGHCLGAAGAVEALITMNVLKRRVAPATFGLDELDRECSSRCFIREDTELYGGIGLVLSYGFGGHLAALVIESPR